MPTRHGVEYDLSRSPYRYICGYFEFSFSSPKHLESFKDKMQQRIDWMRDSFKRRFHFEIDTDLIALMQLYCLVETRGFHVRNLITNEVYRCRENIILLGMQVNGKD